MKEIVLVLSTTNRWSSRFLRWAQRCEYSHVEVEVQPGKFFGARTRGVRFYNDSKDMTVQFRRSIEVTDEQYEKFYEFLESKQGDKYDWRAYLGFAFFKKTHGPDKWFCSELIVEACYYAGIDIVIHTPSWFSTPRDFLITPVLKDGDISLL